MKAVILHAKQGSAFHFGEYTPHGETFLDHTSSFPHSDTIFSALVSIHNQLWPEETDLFIKLFSSGMIRISSGMFCFRGKKGSIYFLPRPAMMKTPEGSDRKKYRNIEWISPGLWLNGLAGGDGNDGITIAGKHFACLKKEWDQLTDDHPGKFIAFEADTVPRVMIHSPSREDTLYQQTSITLCGSPTVNVSYYFMAAYDKLDPAHKDKLETVISLLPDTGLGGQRTTGCGFFEGAEWTESPLPEISGKPLHVSLGLLSPGKDLAGCLAYQLITRGGRRTEKGKLKKILMLREGAVTSNGNVGEILDISPSGDRSSLRCGKSLTHPVDADLINM